MAMSELAELVREAVFEEIRKFRNLRCRTKPVKSRAKFLRQYFEGSLACLVKNEDAWRAQFRKLANSQELGRLAKGRKEI
jgi:hypothetical protein